MNRKDLERISLLVKIKKIEEKLCAQEFSKIRKKIVDTENEMYDIAKEQKLIFGDIESQLLSSNLLNVSSFYEYVNYLEYEMGNLQRKLEELREEEESRRKELEKKIQRRKTFERLQEKKEEEVKYWYDKEFQKSMDDIVNARWNLR